MLSNIITSGISVSIANVLTNPIDTIKTRLQLQKIKEQHSKKGIWQTGVQIVRNEGVVYLYNGVGASVVRGLVFGGLRMGMYEPIKTALFKESTATLSEKIIAGSLSGGGAALVSSPLEMIKTNLQSSNRTRNSMDVVRQIYSKHGLTGMWAGSVPGIIRSCLLTASQCATYDEVKNTLISKAEFKDGVLLHLMASMTSGILTTTVTNPIDVVKTHMFVSRGEYTGLLDCFKSIAKNDGFQGFMKGWTATYARLGPQTVIMFVVTEQLKKYI